MKITVQWEMHDLYNFALNIRRTQEEGQSRQSYTVLVSLTVQSELAHSLVQLCQRTLKKKPNHFLIR